MSKPFSLPAEMGSYLAERNTQPDATQQQLIDIATDMPAGGMRLSHESAVFLTLLVRSLRPTFAVEVGTFIGYSALAIAKALPSAGRLLCCDISEEWTTIAREQWLAAGVGDRIDLELGPALDTLAGLPDALKIDFAFIDADKNNYINYYEAIVPKLSTHGVIGVDNTMWSARVLDATDTTDDTVGIRAFNDHVAEDPRTTNVTLPLGDGITLIGLNP